MLHCNSYATWIIWEHTQQKDVEMMVGYLKQLTNSFVCNLNCRNMNNYDRHTPITIFTRHLYLDIIDTIHVYHKKVCMLPCLSPVIICS